ncbi:MAG TPA: MipA/OmpV family protein [Steroidobacteraceae bacterium]
MHHHILSVLPIVLGLVGVQAAGAADDCKGPSADCVAVGHWNFSVALGAGAMTNPLAGGKAIPLVVVPQFSYYGKRFFIDDLDLGLTLGETDGSTFNLVATPGYDRVFFYRADLQNIFVQGFGSYAIPVRANAATPGAVQVPPRPRHVTYLAGPEWTGKYGGITGQFDVLHEITGQNHGNEVRAAVGVPLLEGKGTLTANIGVTWKSADIVNYYYGAATIYRGGSALDPFIKLGYTLPLAGKWRFYAFAEYERLAGAIADSPLVAERYVATSFIGAIYTF